MFSRLLSIFSHPTAVVQPTEARRGILQRAFDAVTAAVAKVIIGSPKASTESAFRGTADLVGIVGMYLSDAECAVVANLATKILAPGKPDVKMATKRRQAEDIAFQRVVNDANAAAREAVRKLCAGEDVQPDVQLAAKLRNAHTLHLAEILQSKLE